MRQRLSGARLAVAQMYYVYVLQSLRNGKRYIGMTGRDPYVRLREHQSEAAGWTRYNGPFELVHTEVHASKTVALQREQFLKSGHGREALKDILAKKQQVVVVSSLTNHPHS